MYTFKYYFNAKEDEHGCHEVHAEYCRYLPQKENLIYIGEFTNCSLAINEAKLKYPHHKFDGCFYCCRTCHEK